MNYYEHHIGDYAQATAHLSILEDGVYSRLMRKYYADESPLPRDLKKLERLVGARNRPEKAAVKNVLEEFFTEEADGWHNKRCDEEIARCRSKQEKARGSANARWSKRQAQVDGKADAMRTHQKTDANALPPQSEGNALQSPVSSHQTPQESEGRADAGAIRPEDPGPPLPPADDRERWLACRAAYPPGTYRENDWQNAERNARMCIEAGLCHWDQLRAAAVRYADQLRAMRKLGTQYVMKPSAWFHRDNHSWDEPFPLPAAEGKGTKAEEVKGSGLPSLN